MFQVKRLHLDNTAYQLYIVNVINDSSKPSLGASVTSNNDIIETDNIFQAVGEIDAQTTPRSCLYMCVESWQILLLSWSNNDDMIHYPQNALYSRVMHRHVNVVLTLRTTAPFKHCITRPVQNIWRSNRVHYGYWSIVDRHGPAHRSENTNKHANSHSLLQMPLRCHEELKFM